MIVGFLTLPLLQRATSIMAMFTFNQFKLIVATQSKTGTTTTPILNSLFSFQFNLYYIVRFRSTTQQQYPIDSTAFFSRTYTREIYRCAIREQADTIPHQYGNINKEVATTLKMPFIDCGIQVFNKFIAEPIKALCSIAPIAILKTFLYQAVHQ